VNYAVHRGLLVDKYKLTRAGFRWQQKNLNQPIRQGLDTFKALEDSRKKKPENNWSMHSLPAQNASRDGRFSFVLSSFHARHNCGNLKFGTYLKKPQP